MGHKVYLREGNKEEIISELAEAVTKAILQLEDGAEVTISYFVKQHYLRKGYEFKHINGNLGWIWTGAGGETYAIKAKDQFDVMDLVLERLKGERDVDFSRYAGLKIGQLYDIPFIVRKKGDS